MGASLLRARPKVTIRIPHTLGDLQLLGAGIFAGWILLIVGNDVLTLFTSRAERLSRVQSVVLIVAVAGAIGLIALHQARPHGEPCVTPSTRR